MNTYSSIRLDRAAHLRREIDWLRNKLGSGESCCIPLWQEKNLVRNGEICEALFPRLSKNSPVDPQECIFLGMLDGEAFFTYDCSELETPPVHEDGRFEDLRTLAGLLPLEEGALLAYARGMCHWHRSSRFCSRCGEATQVLDAGHQKKCLNPSCGFPQFPRTDPAVIMLVHDGDHVVLGRQQRWPPGMHSILAGFVEPGESLEDTVIREVKEEVGIDVEHPQYESSQPWPFPSSLMLGFRSIATPGQSLTVNTEELESARWFSRKELKQSPENEDFRMPRKDSIARRLLDEWLAEDN